MSTIKKNVSLAKETGKKEQEEKSVIFAEKNMYFGDFGHIDKGFNIVKTKFLHVYLDHKAVRQATPEELAKKYDK
jgi:hypothetical protein